MSVTEYLEKLVVNVASPDETVRGTYAKRTGMRLTLQPDAFRYHDVGSLAVQVEKVLTGLMRGYRTAGQLALVENDAVLPPGSPRNRLFARLEKEAENIEVVEESADGYVVLRFNGPTDFIVAIHPSAFNRLDEDRLTTELNSTVGRVMRRYRGELMGLYRRCFWPPTDHV